jgi:hypothetical protein
MRKNYLQITKELQGVMGKCHTAICWTLQISVMVYRQQVGPKSWQVVQ